MAVTEQDLKLLTNSRARCFRSCPRKHHIKYEQGYVPLTTDEALLLGTLVHIGLEHWWIERGHELRLIRHLGGSLTDALDSVRGMAMLTEAGPANPLGWALNEMATAAARDGLDPFLVAKGRAMVRAYDARWAHDDSMVPIAVEIEFTAPLINPLSGKPSQVWRTAGKLDVLVSQQVFVQVGEDEWAPDRKRTVIVEHKTSGEDIGVGSMYWRRLRMDGQVSTYYEGADANGFNPETMLWDVLKKPALKPLKATPEADRKYTKAKTKPCPDCKKYGTPVGDEPAHAVHLVAADGESPDGPYLCEWDHEAGKRVLVIERPRLYSAQRETDETVEEFEQRCFDAIMADMPAMLVREEIPRTTAELSEYRLDLWHLQKIIRESEISGRAPRNPDACDLYHRPCSYIDVCTGLADLNDPTKFRRLSSPHQELATLTEEV